MGTEKWVAAVCGCVTCAVSLAAVVVALRARCEWNEAVSGALEMASLTVGASAVRCRSVGGEPGAEISARLMPSGSATAPAGAPVDVARFRLESKDGSLTRSAPGSAVVWAPPAEPAVSPKPTG